MPERAFRPLRRLPAKAGEPAGPAPDPLRALDSEDRGLAALALAERYYLRCLRALRDRDPARAVIEFQKTLGLNDFYFGSKDWEFPMGHISFVGKLDGVALSAGAPAIAPGFTLDLMAKHSLDFWLTSEDLPDPSNRVTLDKKGNIVLSYKPNNLEPHKRLQAKLQELMKQQTKCDVHGHDCHQGLFARSLYLGQRIPLAGVAHQNGTIRFGHDPKTSALDANCKAHDVDNLYVVDGSFFQRTIEDVDRLVATSHATSLWS